jgi:hypothetical protein
LLDPADLEQAGWNAKMERLLKEYAIPFKMRPLPADDAAKAAEVAKEVQSMPAPVTVVAPQTPDEDGKPRIHTQAALAFIKAYGRIAPSSFAAKPNWHLDHTAKGAYQFGDTTAGTAEK